MIVTLSLVSLPPTIQDACPLWLKTFGLELQFCRRSTLNVVSGPDTNTGELARLIKTVQKGKHAHARIVLYSRVGTGALFYVRAQPSSTSESMELAMSQCDAVSLAEAARSMVKAAEDKSVKVLLQAKKPFRVVHVSSAFVDAYGFEPEETTNRTLSMIQGPTTDLNAWTEMLNGAISGSEQAANIQTYASNGAECLTHVKMTPVRSEKDIRYLLIAMSRTPAHRDVFRRSPSYAQSDLTHDSDTSASASLSSKLLRHAPATRLAWPTTREARGFLRVSASADERGLSMTTLCSIHLGTLTLRADLSPGGGTGFGTIVAKADVDELIVCLFPGRFDMFRICRQGEEREEIYCFARDQTARNKWIAVFRRLNIAIQAATFE